MQVGYLKKYVLSCYISVFTNSGHMISKGSQSEHREQLTLTSLASKITAGSFSLFQTEAFNPAKHQTFRQGCLGTTPQCIYLIYLHSALLC